MWILGGWFSSFEPCPRDVWRSRDGRNWTRVQQAAPWKHGDLPMTLVFGDRMWLMGGWFNGLLPGCSASSEVWSSSDGLSWKQVTACAGWSPRLAAGAIVFQDKMWILGGIENYFLGDDTSLRNDVWCSSDGETWELATEQAGWSPRAFHQAVGGGKMWVLGGGNYVPNHFALNDVWCSEDGVEWTQVDRGCSMGAPALVFIGGLPESDLGSWWMVAGGREYGRCVVLSGTVSTGRA